VPCPAAPDQSSAGGDRKLPPEPAPAPPALSLKDTRDSAQYRPSNQTFERRMAKISLIQSVLRCKTASTMTEVLVPVDCQGILRMSSTRGLPLVRSGALPLASTFKCEFVAQRMSLSSCEPLAGTARQEIASGDSQWRAQ
jgi:hypothetical protein